VFPFSAISHVFLMSMDGQNILHASLDHDSLSVEKFARWLRAICTIILSRNTAADRVKAIGYVEQALSVMEQNDDGDEVRIQAAFCA